MRRQGYTLLEMILVLAVMVILASLTIPSLSTMYGQYKVTASCDTIKGAMATARSQAIEDGIPYRFAFVPGKGNYRVAPDLPGFWTGLTGPQKDSNGNKVLVLEGSLPNGIGFPEGDTAFIADPDATTALELDEVQQNQWRPIAVFLPDGSARVADDTPRDLIVIPIGARESATMVVRLRCLTGTVSIRRLDAQGDQ